MAQIEVINKRITELAKLLPNFEASCSTSILEGAALISKTFNSGLKVLICGNGGSAADSQHFAAEFVSAFSRDLNRKALPAMALTVDTSVITAFCAGRLQRFTRSSFKRLPTECLEHSLSMLLPTERL